ncbi:hypothetical protein ACTXT7_008655 [Hymenolepis weldensis]
MSHLDKDARKQTYSSRPHFHFEDRKKESAKKVEAGADRSCLVVEILKRKKRSCLRKLVKEVKSLLSPVFTPELWQIKNVIEVLIWKNIVKRDPDDMDWRCSNLLTFYATNWKKYPLWASFIDRRCDLLNRAFIRQRVEDRPKEYTLLYVLFILSWRDRFYMPLRNRIKKALLKEIFKERNGVIKLRPNLKIVIDSLLGLSLTEQVFQWPDCIQANKYFLCGPKSFAIKLNGLPWKLEPTLYIKFFENSFLKESAQYYAKMSERYLANHSVSDYLKWTVTACFFSKVEVCIEDEKKRSDAYLYKDTNFKLFENISTPLIKNQIRRIAPELVNLVKDDRTEDVTRMCKVLSHYEEGISQLAQFLEIYVTELGSDALEKICDAAKEVNMTLNGTEHSLIKKPIVFVDAIIEVMSKCEDLLNEVFDKKLTFKRAIERGYERFMNKNAVMQTAGLAPQLLAKSADFILRKSEYSQEVGLYEKLAHIIAVLRLIEDKDAFLEFYKNRLARRLVFNQSTSLEAENEVINHLRRHCGFDYTSKVTTMLKDAKQNRYLKNIFSNWLEARRNQSEDLPVRYRNHIQDAHSKTKNGFWYLE